MSYGVVKIADTTRINGKLLSGADTNVDGQELSMGAAFAGFDLDEVQQAILFREVLHARAGPEHRCWTVRQTKMLNQ